MAEVSASSAPGYALGSIVDESPIAGFSPVAHRHVSIIHGVLHACIIYRPSQGLMTSWEQLQSRQPEEAGFPSTKLFNALSKAKWKRPWKQLTTNPQLLNSNFMQ